MSSTGQRREGLDTLRLFAILAVMFDHFVGQELFRPGEVSVRFFLLLSGFLITRTLMWHGSTNWTDYRYLLKSFYARRALRIWPLYYLILIASLLLGWISLLEFSIHGLFLTNFYQAWLNSWSLPDYLAHIWTLCVQEQFYLVWPVLFMLFGTRRWVFLVAMVTAAVGFRFGMWRANLSDEIAFYTLPIASFGALALGSLLAIIQERVTIRYPVFVIASLLLSCLWVKFFGNDFMVKVILPTLWLLPLSVLTLAIFNDQLGAFSQLLEWKPFVFLGQISLGIYLLHLPVGEAFYQWSPDWLDPYVMRRSLTAFAIFTPVTLLLATISWLFFEKPLQRFRKFFPYDRPAQDFTGVLIR